MEVSFSNLRLSQCSNIALGYLAAPPKITSRTSLSSRLTRASTYFLPPILEQTSGTKMTIKGAMVHQAVRVFPNKSQTFQLPTPSGFASPKEPFESLAFTYHRAALAMTEAGASLPSWRLRTQRRVTALLKENSFLIVRVCTNASPASSCCRDWHLSELRVVMLPHPSPVREEGSVESVTQTDSSWLIVAQK